VKGLRRHLPSPFTVRADWGDGATFVAAKMWFCILSCVPKRQGSLLYLFSWKRKEEGAGIWRVQLPVETPVISEACEEFHD
jgi:hypothetical protein